MNTHLTSIQQLFEETLQDNMLGLYVYGSVAMNCFNPTRSDIDLLIVVKARLKDHDITSLTQRLLALRDTMTPGIECSVMLEEHLFRLVHPTPCEYHFSDYHLERYRSDPDYRIVRYEDPDLASQATMAYLRGITLYGKPLAERYPVPDERAYMASILHDIEDADSAILSNSLYTVLNLCRVLYYVREGAFASKKEGGEWALTTLPANYRPMVQMYVNAYTGPSPEEKADPAQLAEFAAYMCREIDHLLESRT